MRAFFLQLPYHRVHHLTSKPLRMKKWKICEDLGKLLTPKPESREFLRDSPSNPRFGVTNRRFGRYNFPRKMRLSFRLFFSSPRVIDSVC